MDCLKYRRSLRKPENGRMSRPFQRPLSTFLRKYERRLTMAKVNITLEIPDKTYEKLEKYGYNWEKNSEEKAKEVYLCLCLCEEYEIEPKK